MTQSALGHHLFPKKKREPNTHSLSELPLVDLERDASARTMNASEPPKMNSVLVRRLATDSLPPYPPPHKRQTTI